MKDFNKIAAKIGSNARIEKKGKKIIFQRYLGYNSADGREWVQKITADEFQNLIKKFPELH